MVAKTRFLWVDAGAVDMQDAGSPAENDATRPQAGRAPAGEWASPTPPGQVNSVGTGWFRDAMRLVEWTHDRQAGLSNGSTERWVSLSANEIPGARARIDTLADWACEGVSAWALDGEMVDEASSQVAETIIARAQDVGS
jgi:citrate lyase beta subunit